MLNKLYSIFLKHPVVCIDTRAISTGCLFFALKGPNFNANEFAITALQKGASYAVVDEAKYVLDERYILVKDVLTTLQNLANHHRKQLKCPVLAITGTNGKTTSKELTYRVLKQKYKTSATKGNLNNHIGVPLSLLAIEVDTEYAIIEMGANHVGEIAQLCEIAEPDIGVITNIGKAHLEGFGSLEGVLRAKTELYDYLGNNSGCVFTKDNQQNLLELSPVRSKQFTYGQLNTSNYIIKFINAQPYVSVTVNELLIKSQLIGDYNFDNIALSIAIGNYCGVEIDEIKKAIENYIPTNNRSQLLKTTRNSILLDAYNANPMSVEKAIHNMLNIDHKHKVLVLGDMFELGEDSKREHVNIINQCLSAGFSEVYLVGEAFTNANTTEYPSFGTTQELVNALIECPITDAFILIKGSRGMKLEQVAKHL
tara:strand:+ start:2575 stop:3849 length:1275 start_codon:yes stop_codon:yes gene_type:complete